MGEIFNGGSVPWPLYSNTEVAELVKQGERISQEDCPKSIYEIILACTEYNPVIRPSFGKILSDLENCSMLK